MFSKKDLIDWALTRGEKLNIGINIYTITHFKSFSYLIYLTYYGISYVLLLKMKYKL